MEITDKTEAAIIAAFAKWLERSAIYRLAAML